MAYRRLFLLVEGNDDERFVATIVKPKLHVQYDHVRTWQYAGRKQEKIEGFLKSIHAIGAEYIVFADLDASPCPAARKDQLANRFAGLSADRVFVVVKEIESWYLAGISERAGKALGIGRVGPTDGLTKEEFDRQIPRRFDSRIDFMLEMLKCFDLAMAGTQNKSFSHFLKKVNLRG